jgi:hypothetical protein
MGFELWPSVAAAQREYWAVGLMAIIVLAIKVKWIISFKKPLFHHSNIPLFHD